MKANAWVRRRGFTLVEMLVAAAVSILLMVILTQAFGAGLEMFRKLRAQGNLQERLRMASITLRDDLTAQHFQGNDSRLSNQHMHQAYDDAWSPPDGGFFRVWTGQMTDLAGVPVTEPSFPLPWPNGNNGVVTPLPFALEGTDPEGLIFCRATTHLLHFTMKRRGEGLNEMFRTTDTIRGVPGPPAPPRVFPGDFVYPSDYREGHPTDATQAHFTSMWAEVAYFLVPTGQTTVGGVPRFALHRRVKLLIPPEAPTNEVSAMLLSNPEVSTRTQLAPPLGQFYNRPTNVTQPRHRSYMLPAPDWMINVMPTYTPMIAGLMEQIPPTRMYWSGNRYPALAEDLVLGTGDPSAGNDVLLYDVLSFEVKAWWDVPANAPNFRLTTTEINALRPRTQYNYGGTVIANTDYPFDYIPFSTKNAFFANDPSNPLINLPRTRVFDTWSKAGPYGTSTPPGNPRPPGPPPSPPGQPPGPPPYPPGQGGGVEEWRRSDPVYVNETAPRLPVPIRIKALQIRIRIWDEKSQQTRQVTIIQDM